MLPSPHGAKTQCHRAVGGIMFSTCPSICLWPGGVAVRALDLRLKRSQVRISTIPLSGRMAEWPWASCSHTFLCHQAVYFGTVQGAVMPCSWRGNRRSGVALAMSQTSMVYPPTGSQPKKGRSAHCLHSSWGMALLFYIHLCTHACETSAEALSHQLAVDY